MIPNLLIGDEKELIYIKIFLLLMSGHSYVVRLGEHDDTIEEGREQEMSLEKIINHPDFTYYTASYDLALIKLKLPAKLTGWNERLGDVGVACFPADNHDMETTFKPGPDIYAMFYHVWNAMGDPTPFLDPIGSLDFTLLISNN